MKMGEIYLRYAQTTVGDLGLRLGRSALASAPDLSTRALATFAARKLLACARRPA